jgi:hypothetical protein
VYLSIRNLCETILWAAYNSIAPKYVQYRRPVEFENGSKPRILVLLIDYDKFSNRTTKVVNGMSYPCGRAGLDTILRFCEMHEVDFINVVTTDGSDGVAEYAGPANRTITVKNGGTDIAALVTLKTFIRNYSHVIVANSSLNSEDANRIGSLYSDLLNCLKYRHFVIGCNGNSRISPRFPIFGATCQHIITNFFACPSADLVDTVDYGVSHPAASIFGGYSNKFFAIRYFEILLSRNAIKNNGMLILLKEGSSTSFPGGATGWPKKDSRFYI